MAMLTVSTLFFLSTATAATHSVEADGSGGFASIQAAIDAASAGDTIEVGPGTFAGSFDFSGKDLSIVATDGPSATMLDGEGLVGFVVHLDNGESVSAVLEGFTIENAWSQGISIIGASPTLTNLVLTGMGDDNSLGGAVSIVDGGATISSCTFSENRAYDGGGLYIAGTAHVVIEDSVFSDNKAVGYTGEDADETTGDGGAIRVGGWGSLRVSDSTFTGNTAYDDGGAILSQTHGGSVMITRSVFEDNNNTVGRGGAVYFVMDNDELAALGEDAGVHENVSIVGSTFEGNKALSDDGGAIAFDGDSIGPITVNIEDTTFTYNWSSRDGGALFAYQLYSTITLSDVVFENNEGDWGGAIYLSSTSDLIMTGTEIARNTAYYGGGGLYGASSCMVTVEDTVFEGNRARIYYGGGVYLYSQDASHPAEFQRVRFSDNTAELEGGGVHFKSVSNSTVEESLFEGNEAGDGSFGGGLYADDSAYVKVRNTVFRSNTATYGGGAYINDNAEGSDFYNNVFLDNEARIGGGFALCNSPYTLFFNNTVAGNRAMDESGGAAFYDSWVEFRNNVFAHNTGGAALHMYDLNSSFYAQLEYNNFYDNEPLDVGGELEESILTENGNMTLDPAFATYAATMRGEDVSLVLSRGSLLIDAGDPFIYDPDGTRSDVGAYGGEWLITEDADLDGYDDSIDCDDADESVFPGGEDSWYDGVNSDCAPGSDYDADGDGEDVDWSGGIDCDDTDPDVITDCPDEEEDEDPVDDGGAEDGVGEDTGGDDPGVNHGEVGQGADTGADTGDDNGGDNKEGCGCTAVGTASGGMWLFALLLPLTRRFRMV
jgi:predicted outer membrane repeat protein